jgi:hypothetical protein
MEVSATWGALAPQVWNIMLSGAMALVHPWGSVCLTPYLTMVAVLGSEGQGGYIRVVEVAPAMAALAASYHCTVF